MQFYEVLAQVIELLQRQGRVSYRALKRQFDLDNEYLEDLKAEIIKAKRLAVDEDGDVLVWTGSSDTPPAPPPRPAPAAAQPARVAPYSGELPSGDHNVEVSSVGYRTVAQQITLVPGQQISLRIALSPAGGSNAPPIVGVNSAPEGALLFLDGKLIGPTPKICVTARQRRSVLAKRRSCVSSESSCCSRLPITARSTSTWAR